MVPNVIPSYQNSSSNKFDLPFEASFSQLSDFLINEEANYSTAHKSSTFGYARTKDVHLFFVRNLPPNSRRPRFILARRMTKIVTRFSENNFPFIAEIKFKGYIKIPNQRRGRGEQAITTYICILAKSADSPFLVFSRDFGKNHKKIFISL